MSDYRNTEYCKNLCGIEIKKQEFKEQILKEHPEISNFYIHIRSNEGPYKRKFIKLYNDKCVYCGNSLDNINIALFEIDHYINEASFSSDNKNEANVIENLVPSCQKCNRGKNGLTITGEYIHILHPEESELLKVFYRDEKYYIRISEAYTEDSFIQKFYDALSLGAQVRRLDYLLLKLKGFKEKFEEGSNIKQQLTEIINNLLEKRNRWY